jgi:hypothetical protein
MTPNQVESKIVIEKNGDGSISFYKDGEPVTRIEFGVQRSNHDAMGGTTKHNVSSHSIHPCNMCGGLGCCLCKPYRQEKL